MEHRPVDFDESAIRAALSDLPLGGLRVFQRIASTNDEALSWAATGAPDLSMVIADEQTSGRGRAGRRWLTPPGTALAMSVVLRGDPPQLPSGRLVGLGAMAVADACAVLGLQATIKWPNDVLLAGRKSAGVLVEAQWSGNRLEASVVGIGINILRGSVPPVGTARYPATCLEEALGTGVRRLEVLRWVVAALISWRSRLGSPGFISAWENRLAFRGDQITLRCDGQPLMTGTLLGMEDDGSLRLMGPRGVQSAPMGEIQLQPSDDRIEG